MRIFLVGYMGSGKSTVGKLLAQQLDVPFVDTDVYIETETGMDITDIFANEGEAHFRAMESAAINALILRYDDAVIATGGGLPCSEAMIKKLIDAGTVVYLKASIKTLTQRLLTSDNRPLVQQYKGQALTQYIRRHLASRRVYYRQASIIVWNRGSVDQVVMRILGQLVR